jgi:hypothetical protein
MDNPEVDLEQSVENVDDSASQGTTQEPEKDDRIGTIAKITNIIRGRGKETSDDSEPEEDTTPQVDAEPEESEDVDLGSEEPDQSDVIDPRFVSAARDYGWSDERIQQYATEHDEADTVMMTEMMARQIAEEEDVDFGLVEPGTEEDEESDVVQEAMKRLEGSENTGELANIVKTLASELQATKNELKEMAEQTQSTAESRKQDEFRQILNTADRFFDEAAKDFKELGQTKNLTRLASGELSPDDPAVVARETIFEVARRFNATGDSWDESLQAALRWYRGGRDDIVESQVLRKIKANSKRISPRRDRRHQTKKYSNEIEEKADVVNSVLRKYNQSELPM